MPHHQANLTYNVTSPQLQPPEDVEQGQQQQDHNLQQPLPVDNAPAALAPGPDNGVGRIQRGSHAVKGFGYLVLLLIYHGLCFIAFLSLSIGIAMLCSVVWELIRFAPLQPRVQSLITLISLAVFAEGHAIGQSQGQLGTWISRKVTQHPIMLGMFLPAIFVGLYLAALSQLYSQYLMVHPVVNPWWLAAAYEGSEQINTPTNEGASGQLESDSTISPEHMANTIKKMNQATTLFMLSISYMIYIAAKSSDWATYRSAHYNFILNSLRLKFCTYFKHLWIQFLLQIVYLVPIILLCIVCRITFLRPDFTYVIIILTCAVIGVNAVIIESKRPFPVVPQEPPYYRFEAHLVARSTVTVYVLHAALLGMFYKSNNKSSHSQHLKGSDHLVLDEYQFDFSDEINFLMYTSAIGLIAIGTFKITLNVYYSKELIFWVQPPRPPTPVHVPEPNLPEEPQLGMEREESTAFLLNLEEPTGSRSESGPVSILVKSKQLEEVAEEIEARRNREHAVSSIIVSDTEPASSSSSSDSGSGTEQNKLLTEQTFSVTKLLPSSTSQEINSNMNDKANMNVSQSQAQIVESDL